LSKTMLLVRGMAVKFKFESIYKQRGDGRVDCDSNLARRPRRLCSVMMIGVTIDKELRR